jgi:hypothetical protein
MSETKNCARCGHPDHWHRHDDATTNDKFRCIGYDCEIGGPPMKNGCGCLDFISEVPSC